MIGNFREASGGKPRMQPERAWIAGPLHAPHVTEPGPEQASLIALLLQNGSVAAWRAAAETFDFAFRTALFCFCFC
jgi:hypothetical protein